MKTIQVINSKKDKLGQIIWNVPGNISVEISDQALLSEINAMIADASQNGIPLRSGEIVQKDGKSMFVEQMEKVKADDPKFLNALSELINKHSFSGQRIFGLVKDEDINDAHQ